MRRLKLEYRCREFVAIFLLEEVALFLYTLLILKSLQCLFKIKKIYMRPSSNRTGSAGPVISLLLKLFRFSYKHTKEKTAIIF